MVLIHNKSERRVLLTPEVLDYPKRVRSYFYFKITHRIELLETKLDAVYRTFKKIKPGTAVPYNREIAGTKITQK